MFRAAAAPVRRAAAQVRTRTRQPSRGSRGSAVGVMLYELLCNGQHPAAKPMPDEAIIDPKTIRSDLDGGLAEFLRPPTATHGSRPQPRCEPSSARSGAAL
jgi:hypothetical protein